jgi:hypothetical protein
MNNFTNSIKLQAAKTIFQGVSFEVLPTGGYKAIWRHREFCDKSLTNLCKNLWNHVTASYDGDVAGLIEADRAILRGE